MKKGLLTIAVLAIASSLAQAQTEKGRWLVGGQVGGGTYQDQSLTRSFSIDLSPSVGYFVANNLVVGADVPLGLSTTRTNRIVYPATNFTPVSTLSTEYGLAPFARYYIGAGKLKPYIGVAYTYGRTRTKTDLPDISLVTNRGSYNQITPTIGVAYFISRNVALNVGVSYNIRRDNITYLSAIPPAGDYQSSTYQADNNSFGLNIGFQILFGD